MVTLPPRYCRMVLLAGFLFGCLLEPARAGWEFVAGDADRDGRDDLALIGRGEWNIWMSGKNYAMEGPYDLDLSGGRYAMGDLDGDRAADLAMLSGSRWHVWRSGNNYVREGPYDCGVGGGKPYLFDFDRDGKDDPCAVVGYRWHVWLSGSDYKTVERFGDGPLDEKGLIPAVFRSPGGPVPAGTYFGYMKDGWLELRRYNGSGRHRLKLAQGVLAVGLFDDHHGDDLMVVQQRPNSFHVYTWFSGDNYHERGPHELNSGNAPGVGAMVWQDDSGSYGAASVYNIADLTAAAVSINGAPLAYSRKLSFTTAAGRKVSLDLPFYYAKLPGVKTGTQVACSVYAPGPTLIYRSRPATVPAPVRLTAPADGARLPLKAPVPMSWTEAPGIRGYLAYYNGANDYTPSEDGAWHAAYLAAPRTGYTIPAGKTVWGPAEFGVAALNGDVDALLGSEDKNDCFLAAGSWDENATRFPTPTPVPQPPPSLLPIAREYAIKEEGLKFHIRESDPYKMPHPGTVTVNLKLRRWRISIAFVTAFDMEGRQYFTWDKARIYKRKNKKYAVTFPCLPGSTVVIGTHKASLRSALYDFAAGRFLESRDLIVYPQVGSGDWGDLWEGSASSLWSGFAPGFLTDSGDYNGDGTRDLAVYRFSSGLWSVRGVTRAYFGSAEDLPVPGDYDGDGTASPAVFRPKSGLWALPGGERTYFGGAGDLPVPGDYDGDGAADLAVFRPASGLWAVRGLTRLYFGGPGDLPVPGYYTPDRIKTFGIFRPASGLWAVRGLTRAYCGASGDTPVPGDYGGEGNWTPGIFRPSSGLWDVQGLERAYLGAPDVFPVPGDYAGDGTDRIGIFRRSGGLWAIPGITRVYFGTGLDVPVTR